MDHFTLTQTTLALVNGVCFEKLVGLAKAMGGSSLRPPLPLPLNTLYQDRVFELTNDAVTSTTRAVCVSIYHRRRFELMWPIIPNSELGHAGLVPLARCFDLLI